MTRQLAVDYATEMRVNCICPGTVDTPFVEAYLEKYHRHEKEKVRAELNARQPVGRLGRPEEIAHMVLYLCSPRGGIRAGRGYVDRRRLDGGLSGSTSGPVSAGFRPARTCLGRAFADDALGRGGPFPALHVDRGMLDAQHVEGVQLAAAARGDRGAGLHDQRGVSGDAVPRGGVARVAEVEVAGQENVGAAARRVPAMAMRGAADEIALGAARRQVEGMVGDDDLGDAVVEASQRRLNTQLDLLAVDASALQGKGARGVDAHHHDLVVRHKPAPRSAVDVAAVAVASGPEEARGRSYSGTS